MKISTQLLLWAIVQLSFINAFSQSCSNNILTDANGYYGGFESGNYNFSSTTAGTDYTYGMPANGKYEVVNYTTNAGGGGYKGLAPHSGSWLMIAHTKSSGSNRLWYKTVSVTPGNTYQFCAWVANVKTDPVNGFEVDLNVNGTKIAGATAVYAWSQLCGSYTVPAGVTSIEISVTDPLPNNGPSHFLALDDLCFTNSSAAIGTIGNFVWNDTDGDGQKDPNEPGIGGILVSLYRDDNSDNIPDGPAIATTNTTAQGFYSFTGLINGRYIASIPIIPGYNPGGKRPTSPDPDNNVDNDNNAINAQNGVLYTNAITLTSGSAPTNDGDDANGNLTLDLALCGNGYLGDFVWNDVNGNGIQDANEAGIPNATVSLTYADGTIKTVTTDNNGLYYFPNLGPGTYPLTFTTPSGFVPSPANQGSDDTKDSDPVNGKVSVTLGVNESNLTIDAGFFTGSGNLVLGNLVWNDVNGNGIKESNEAGVAGVTVMLYRDADGNNVPDGSAIATTTTNAHGFYTFTGLADGKYIVGLIIPSGYTISPTHSATPDNDIDNDNNGINVINQSELRTNFITLAAGTEPTNDGDDNNGNLTLDLAICGRSNIGDFVWKDINCNGIQDAGEPGIAGVVVSLTYPDGTVTTTTTDANGLYKFVNLGPGVHKVAFATPAGYNPAAANQGSDDSKDSDPVNGSVNVTVLATTNDYTIDAGYCAGSLSLGNLVWNDTDGDGKKDPNEPGIGGMVVKLYRDDNADNLPDGGPIATTTTDAQGAYLFTGLSNGRYITSITVIPGYLPGGVQPTSANPDNDVDNDNNAINRVGNELYTNAITLNAGTEPTNDGSGLNSNLTFDLALCGNSYIGDFVWNDTNGNGIQDANEPGIAGATVSILYADGTTKTVTTDANGIYYFPNLGPGTYTVTFITPANFSPSPANQGTDDALDSDPVNGSVNVSIVANQSDMTIDAGFTQAASLRLGNMVWNDINNNGIKDAGETGIAGVTVSLYKDDNADNTADAAAVATTVTAVDGTYLFNNLPAGKYIVGVTLPAGYGAATANAGGSTPDNDLDNDNNGVVILANEVRSNYITLAANSEPTNDGDDSNGNLTLDFGLKVTDSGCAGNLVANTNGYFGGFEAGSNNILPNTGGSDYTLGLPKAGTYQIVHSISELNGGPYLSVQPHAGDYFFATHTNNSVDDRIWYTKVNVTPGATYNFCVYTALLKDDAKTAKNVLSLYVNGSSIATGTVTAGWTQLCGSYTVPAGVTSVELAIKDPKKGQFFVALDDICFTKGQPSGVIGDYVFYDVNKNGIQDVSEHGINNVVVTLDEGNGVTRTTTTDINGFYQFTNVSAGTKTVSFTTPDGYIASPANVGSDDTKDSDPVNGSVTFTLSANQINNTIDAGFYLNQCTAISGSCGAGYIQKTTTLITNGSFTLPVSAPAAGDTYKGVTNADAGATYYFVGGQYKSQSDYRGTGYADEIGGTQNAHSIINTNGAAYTASFSGQEDVNQLPFPGDPSKGVPASNSFMFFNGNQFGPNLSLVWEQTVSGLIIGKTYTFRFYATNLMEPVSGTDNYHDPLLVVKFDGTSGAIDGTHVFPDPSYITPDYYQLTKSETSNTTYLKGWKRFEITFVATGPTKILKILDCAKGNVGDALGITGIGLEVCEKDTDGDCIADVDDIDDDNDGILDVVENGGYDALADCDGDGIPNYLDPTPGCPTPSGTDLYGKPFKPLIWTDCNNDGVNDFFDWDRDGIINELDLDSDNDGILDVQETRDPRMVDNNNDGMVDGIDEDGDGLLSTADFNDHVYGGPGLTPEDLDRDGTPNYLDLDSDGDGISDITEALGHFDSDGLVDGTNDDDHDGVMTVNYTNNDNDADNYKGFGAKGILMLDDDHDGIPNAYDIDSDNDGITDNVEGQPTCSEKQPTGVDTDGDGLDDAYDTYNNLCVRRAPGITPYDKDGDGTPDIYDLDTDNDGAPDVNEGSGIYGNFVTNFADTDGDGLIDQFDIFNIKTATGLFINNVAHSNMGPNGNFDGPVPAGSNAKLPQSQPGSCPNVDRDWRNVSILPVTLLEFKGNQNNGTVALSWKVTNESNISHYVVERSVDGVSFSPVGKVAATGNGSVTTSYSLNDDVSNLATSIVYYRLQQVEVGGNAKLSNTLVFKLTAKDEITMSVYPNPVSSYFVLKVQVPKEGIAMMRLMDVTGKTILSQNSKVSAGTSAITINNLSNIAAGTYHLQVIINGEVLNQKLVVVK